MLTDFERKLLRILFNLYGMQPARPDLDRLSRLTGRRRIEIEIALRKLQDERRIGWDKRKGIIWVVDLGEHSSPRYVELMGKR